MTRFKHVFLAPLLLGLLLPLVAMAGGGVSFGFSTDVQTSGSADNPTLTSVVVSKVGAASPAQAAGLKVGDTLLSANGTTVPGATAADFMQVMGGLQPGDHLVLMVQRSGSHVPRKIDMTAAAKP